MIKTVKKPWGEERVWAQTDNYIGKILTINPGYRLSLEYHEEKNETIYVLEGVLRVWDSEDDNFYRMYTSGSVVDVKPNHIHLFGAAIGEPCVKLMEVSAPELLNKVEIKNDHSD